MKDKIKEVTRYEINGRVFATVGAAELHTRERELEEMVEVLFNKSSLENLSADDLVEILSKRKEVFELARKTLALCIQTRELKRR